MYPRRLFSPVTGCAAVLPQSAALQISCSEGGRRLAVGRRGQPSSRRTDGQPRSVRPEQDLRPDPVLHHVGDGRGQLPSPCPAHRHAHAREAADVRVSQYRTAATPASADVCRRRLLSAPPRPHCASLRTSRSRA